MLDCIKAGKIKIPGIGIELMLDNIDKNICLAQLSLIYPYNITGRQQKFVCLDFQD